MTNLFALLRFRSECVKRAFRAKIKGPVITIKAAAVALNVVLYPCLSSKEFMTKGIIVPEAPAVIAIIPNAIPLRATHHLSTILIIG